MANIVTLNQLTDVLRQWSKSNPLINEFGIGPTSLIGQTESMEFPYMWLTYQQSSNLIVSKTHITPSISYHALFMDKTNKFDNNRDDNGLETTDGNEVKSDQYQTALDFSRFLTDLSSVGAVLEDDITLQSIIDDTKEIASGWMVSFTLKLRYFDCNSYYNPKSGIVVPPNNNNNCDPVTVYNSDNTYSISLNSGSSKELPDTILTIIDEDENVLNTINIPATNNYEYEIQSIASQYDIFINNSLLNTINTDTNIQITDTSGNILNGTIDSNSNKYIIDLNTVCPTFTDVEFYVNTVLIDTYQSGDQINLSILDTDSNKVGSFINNNYIIGDNNISINNDLFKTINAESNLNIPIVDENGIEVGTIDNNQIVVQTNNPGPNDPNIDGNVLVYNNKLNNKSIQLFSGGKTIYDNFESILHNFSSPYDITSIDSNQYNIDNTSLYYTLNNSYNGLNIVNLTSNSLSTINISDSVGSWTPYGLNYISDLTDDEVQVIGARNAEELLVTYRYNLNTSTGNIYTNNDLSLASSGNSTQYYNVVKYVNNIRYIFVHTVNNNTVDKSNLYIVWNSSGTELINSPESLVANYSTDDINNFSEIYYKDQYYYIAISTVINETAVIRTSNPNQITLFGPLLKEWTNFQLRDMIYSDTLDLFILGGVNINTDEIEIYTSTDATNWTLRYSNDVDYYNFQTFYDGINTIQTTVRGSEISLTSNDGINWTEIGSFRNEVDIADTNIQPI